MSNEQPNVPYGFCYCGCGQRTPIARWTDKRYGVRKGEPCHWRQGHWNRPPISVLLARFWVRVEKGDGCWLWHGTRCDGYGHFRGHGKSRGAHRIAYELLIGPVPEGLELDHLCRNRGCVNPAHLEPVTHEENWRRGQSFSAVNAQKTHCPHGHEYTPENTYRSASHPRSRRCRQCIRDYNSRPNPKEIQE